MSVAAKMPLGMELGLGPGDVEFDGDPAPPSQKGAKPPKFSNNVYCGQTAGCIKMTLGTAVGLSPGDRDRWKTSLPKKGVGAPFPIFGPFLLWPND